MKKYLFLLLIGFFLIPNAYATNCIETGTCMPVNPLDVFNLYDVWFGSGWTLVIMATIIATITVAIYVRTRSLPFLTILGIYEIAAFSSIATSKLVASQYNYAIIIFALSIATAITMLILRMVKE